MRCWSFLCLVVGVISVAETGRADVLFESGTLGPTGVARGEVPGANVSNVVFNGARFQLAAPAITTRVGGHFVGSPGTTDTLFGAIVKLDDEHDFPNSGNLATPDVVGSTVIAFPESSAEVFGDLVLSLEPGWYAIVFGSGLFGAVGDGAMPLNNPDVGEPTYIGWQPGAVLGWGNLINPIFRNYRFVVQGHAVPEPASGVLMLFSSLPLLFLRKTTR